jgi:hypothetical protein
MTRPIPKDVADNYVYYASRVGRCCPYCPSTNLKFEDFSDDGQEVSREVSCINCYGRWKEIFHLSQIQTT